MRTLSLNAFIRRHPTRFRLISVVAVVAAIAFFLPGKSSGEAPFADALGSLVEHYDRRTPALASSGAIRDGAFGRLAELGLVNHTPPRQQFSLHPTQLLLKPWRLGRLPRKVNLLCCKLR